MSELDPASAPLTDKDRAILANVPQAIVQGQDLKEWWAHNRVTRDFPQEFPVAIQFSPPDHNYGFLVDANLRQGRLPLAGVVQGQLYDYPKAPPGLDRVDPLWVRSQVKEFVLNYFMRLTSAMPPPVAAWSPKAQPPDLLRPFSQCDPGKAQRYGWGYQQCYYKLKATGQIGKFPASRSYEIIDLREVGTRYDWVVFLVTIFHFDIVLPPAGAHGPKIVIGMPQPVYTVMTPDFVVNQENPAPGVLGEYGYGYSVVQDLTVISPIAALPSTLKNTIETITFRVLESGEVRAHMDFITPQPPRILDLVQFGLEVAEKLSFGLATPLLAPIANLLEGFVPQFDPIYTSLRVLNLVTAGIAADDFCFTKEQLFKILMVLHFTDVVKMFDLSASLYLLVPDWTDPASIPAWAKQGTYGPGHAAGASS
ncbi:MAG TPA: hypothetical protein VHQ90_24355 [Thermoanaerobaculia bacterium]|nr:hypothetical protein [Thermoanaerobaculia bacterium]